LVSGKWLIARDSQAGRKQEECVLCFCKRPGMREENK